MKKIIQKLGLFGLLLALFASLLSASAASTVDWATNAATEPLFNKTSASDFTVIGKTSEPVAAFSYEAETTSPRTDYDSTDISFNLTVTEAKESHTDFHAIFTFRSKEPQNGIWGPANSGLSLSFEKERAVLRRWSMGAIDEERVQQLPVSVTDGKAHQVKIKITGKTVAVSVDGKTMSATYTTLPSSGGFQFGAYRAKVAVSGFDNTTPVSIDAAGQTSGSSSSATTAKTSTPADTTTAAAPAPSNDDASADSSTVESADAAASADELSSAPETETSQTEESSSVTPADASASSDPGEGGSGNTVLIIVTVAVVLACIGGALAYYFLVYKKADKNTQ